MLDWIKEINELWEPVFPFLADFAGKLRSEFKGNIAEAGPFCGVIYELYRRRMGDRFFLLTFPKGVEKIHKEKIADQKMALINIVPTTSNFENVKDGSIDFLFFRGAFFFPSIFKANLPEVMRILRKGGLAILGGGFGKGTPKEIMEAIKERSRTLNFLLGKEEIGIDQIEALLKESDLEGKSELIDEGGLWLVLRK